MKNKIFSVCLTVVFANLFWCLVQDSGSIFSFVPLMGTVSRRQISLDAYDFFIFLIVVVFYMLYSNFGVNISTLRNIPSAFYPAGILEVIFAAATGVFTHFRLWPLLYSVLEGPIKTILSSPEPVRNAFIVTIPLFWILAIVLVNRGASVSSPAPNQTQVMPQPPTW